METKPRSCRDISGSYEHFIVDLNSDHLDLMKPLAHWKYTTTPEIPATAPGYLIQVNDCEIDGDLVCYNLRQV